MLKKISNIGDCGITCDFGEEVDKLIKSVSDQYTKVGVKQGSEASKIKKKFWRKSSDIHDKYEKDSR